MTFQIKWFIILLFLSVFSFLSLAGVRSIYHRGHNIYIEYDANYEFSADKLISNLEQEEAKASLSNPSLTSFVKNQCVILPVCKSNDRICLDYVQKVRSIRKNIKEGFQSERILYEQKQANSRENQMLESNFVHVLANIEQNQWQLRNINQIQDFLLSLMDNQEHVFKILNQFRESHSELEYNQSDIEEQIVKMKGWLAKHYPDDTVLLGFLKTIEKMYKANTKLNTQITNNLYTLLLNGNSEVLDTIWQLMYKMENLVIEQINSLYLRKKQDHHKLTQNETQRQRIERERQELWAGIKAQRAYRVYPKSPVYELFSVCHNCLVQ